MLITKITCSSREVIHSTAMSLNIDLYPIVYKKRDAQCTRGGLGRCSGVFFSFFVCVEVEGDAYPILISNN